MTAISKLLKRTFFVDILTCSMVGFLLLIVPAVMFTDPFAGQMMGGVFLSFVVMNYFAFRESELEVVKFAIIADVSANTILTVISIVGFFAYGLPVWSVVFISGANGFSIIYIYCWITGKKK